LPVKSGIFRCLRGCGATREETMSLFERAVNECGPWMYPLIAGAVFAASVIVERGITLFFRWSIRVPALMEQLEKLIRAGNVERALKLSRAVGREIPVGRVVLAGLEHADDGPSAVEDAMKAATASVRPLLRRRLAALPILGTACLAIGMFGSYQLGGFAPPPGVETPLPFGQPVAMAPALFGGAVEVVASLAFIALLFRALAISRELSAARERLARVLAERGARPPEEAGPPQDGALPRLGNLGVPTGHVES
jgi:biopolymer transport protein ExbB